MADATTVGNDIGLWSDTGRNAEIAEILVET